MSKIAFVFPGQGSQSVGMVGEFIAKDNASKEIMQQADDALGFSLSKLMQEGPQEELTLTYHAQPALLTSGIIVAERLRRAGIEADYTAGHSLGEFAALVFAGAMKFEDAVVTVNKRGIFMDEAVPAGEGAMAAILNMDAEALQVVCNDISKEGHPVQLANINCPGQIVISGTAKGVALASDLAKEVGAKRAIPLVVSGPFHSSLMSPAGNKLAEQLATVQLQHPVIPVVSNVTSELITNADQIQAELVNQVTSPVRWQQNVEKLLDLGVTTFIECGPGKVLAGLIKKINRDAKVLPVYDEQTFADAIDALKGVEQE